MPPKTLAECQQFGLEAKCVLADAVELVLRGEPLPAVAPLLGDLLANEAAPSHETRRAIRIVARLRSLGTVLPGIEANLVAGFDRLLRLRAADAGLLQLWFELVSDFDPATIAALHRATRALDLPNSLDAWTLNRVAALTLLASPAWATRLRPGEVARLRLLASEDIEDRWKAMLDVGGLRIPDAQIAAWLEVDTPEARWRAMCERRIARGRPVRVLEPISDAADIEPIPRPALARLPAVESSTEALEERTQPPHRVLNSGRRCPDCRTADQVRWFYFCSPPETWPALCGREFWFSVCLPCRVRLATVRVSMS